MNRRDILRTALPATAAFAMSSQAKAAPDVNHPAQLFPLSREFYEWRTYRLKDKSQQARIHRYLEDALLPACEAIGAIGPVGAFTEIGPEAKPDMHVLLVHYTAESFVSTRHLLESDGAYKSDAGDYWMAKKETPAFDRIDSWMMVSFIGHTRITPPAQKPRVLEVRTYESHSEERARKKIDMFNNGEIPIFAKCGFENVFFGESLVGPALPNLKYMLAAPDMPANEAGWKKFIGSAEFTAMKNDPQYADTVSKITKLFLQPTPYSQI